MINNEVQVYKDEFEVLESTHQELLNTLNLLCEDENSTFAERKFYIEKLVEVNRQIDDRIVKLAKYRKRSIQSGAIALSAVALTVFSVVAYKATKSK